MFTPPPPTITHKIQMIGDSLGGYFIFACQDFGYPSFKNDASCLHVVNWSRLAMLKKVENAGVWAKQDNNAIQNVIIINFS